jgi:hypothetical protein
VRDRRGLVVTDNRGERGDQHQGPVYVSADLVPVELEVALGAGERHGAVFGQHLDADHDHGLTVGQEWSGYVAADVDESRIEDVLDLVGLADAAGRRVGSNHMLAEVAQTIDSVVIIDHGHLLAQRSVAELTANGNDLEEAFFQLTRTVPPRSPGTRDRHRSSPGAYGA